MCTRILLSGCNERLSEVREMDIERKTARKTGRSLFVFKFINEKDFSDTLRIMRDGVDDMFPDEDDDLETRRMKVLSLWHNNIPYTFFNLLNRT